MKAKPPPTVADIERLIRHVQNAPVSPDGMPSPESPDQVLHALRRARSDAPVPGARSAGRCGSRTAPWKSSSYLWIKYQGLGGEAYNDREISGADVPAVQAALKARDWPDA